MKLYHNDSDFLTSNYFNIEQYERSKQLLLEDASKLTHKQMFDAAYAQAELPLDILVNVKSLKSFSYAKDNIICTGQTGIVDRDKLFLKPCLDKDFTIKEDPVLKELTNLLFSKTVAWTTPYYSLLITKSMPSYNLEIRFKFIFAIGNFFISQVLTQNTKSKEFHSVKFINRKLSTRTIIGYDNHLNNNLMLSYDTNKETKTCTFYGKSSSYKYSFDKSFSHKKTYQLSSFVKRVDGDKSQSIDIAFKHMSSPTKFKLLSYFFPGFNVHYTAKGQLKYKTIYDKVDNNVSHYIVWYGNGNVKSHGRYTTIGREGPFIKYNTDGTIKYKEYYLRGARFGIGTYYKGGKVYKIVDYCRSTKGHIIYKDTSL